MRPRESACRAGRWIATALTSLAVASTASAAPTAPEDIRDIRGPIVIPVWWHWPLLIAALLLSAMAAASAIRWWRRRHVELSPIERARQALARASAEAEAGRSHEWAEIVATTLRGALAARLGSAILPQTTSELSAAEWTRPPLALELDAPGVLALLEACDVARFARGSLDVAALVAFTAAARTATERLFASRHKTSTTPTAATVSP